MENSHLFPPVIILAAGKSERLGVPKGLKQIRKSYWLETQLTALNGWASRAVVVLGFHVEKYFEAIPFLSEGCQREVLWKQLTLNVEVNPEPELGPFSSLQCGIKAILHHDSMGKSKSGVFVLPVDTPVPAPSIWEDLFKVKISDPKAFVALPVFEGKRGHPVWLSHQFIQELQIYSPRDPKSRLDWQIRLLSSEKIKEVESSDSKILMNLNTKEDFMRL